MTLAVSAEFQLALRLLEQVDPGDGTAPITRLHELGLNDQLTPVRRVSGTGANKQNKVWVERRTVVASTPYDLDLAGGPTEDASGTAYSFTTVRGIYVRVRTLTSGRTLTIGATTTPFIAWLKASGDGIKLTAGGTWYLDAPVDGYAVSAGTADVLTFDPGASDVAMDLAIWGQ